MKRLGVVGWPIAHSRSPAIQTAALRAAGLGSEWSYEKLAIESGNFASRIGRLAASGDWVGVNVTIPHKQAALGLADRPSAAAAAIGAANTLSFVGDQIAAENTDAPGLIAALPTSPDGARALVFGAGGAGRAAAWALRQAGADVSIWNRTEARAEAVAAELGIAVLRRLGGERLDIAAFDLLVNSTSVGLDRGVPPSDNDRFVRRTSKRRSPDPALLMELGVVADALCERHLVVDLVYRSDGNPDTDLIVSARQAGARIVNGLEILVRQGAQSFRIWTGLEPDLAVMRAAADNPSAGRID